MKNPLQNFVVNHMNGIIVNVEGGVSDEDVEASTSKSPTKQSTIKYKFQRVL